MHYLEPRHRHPLLWALEDLCGLTRTEVVQQSGLSRSILHSLTHGKAATERVRVALRRALDQALGRMGIEAASYLEKHDGHSAQRREYQRLRTCIYDTIQYVLKTTERTELRHTTPREIFIRTIGAGKRKSDVISQMRPILPQHVRQLKRDLQVVQRFRDGAVWWYLPHDAPRLVTPGGAREPMKTKRARLLWDLVCGQFRGTPYDAEGYRWTRASTIERAALDEGYTRQMLYHTVRNAIVRRTVGFGKAKHAVWSLPAVPQ